MITQGTSHRITVLALIGLIISLIGYGTAGAAEFVDNPEDQGAVAGENVTFSVDPKVGGGLTYQWFRQWLDQYTELPGQTRRSLTLTNVGIADVGLYLCRVTRGDRTVFTEPAALVLYSRPINQTFESQQTSLTGTLESVVPSGLQLLGGGGGGGPLTLFGPPMFSGGGSSDCPGPYVGYVSYRKISALGWGWKPSSGTTIHTATDALRTDTKVEYVGKFGDDDCDQTTVAVPHPTISTKYRFTIYFPSDMPATNAYPITLEGFDP